MSNITINLSLNDLEKILLDKNGELNVKFSEQVADGFAKKYLKSIVHDKVIENVGKSFKEIIHKEIDELYESNRYSARLSDTLKNMISDFIKNELQYIIERNCKEAASDVSSNLLEEQKDIMHKYAKTYYENGINNFIHAIAEEEFVAIRRKYWDTLKMTKEKENNNENS